MRAVPLMKQKLETFLAQAGFEGEDLENAVDISRLESNWRTNAEGDKGITSDKWDYSIGLFQVRSLKITKSTMTLKENLYTSTTLLKTLKLPKRSLTVAGAGLMPGTTVLKSLGLLVYRVDNHVKIQQMTRQNKNLVKQTILLNLLSRLTLERFQKH
jgi:hypothetical protein